MESLFSEIANSKRIHLKTELAEGLPAAFSSDGTRVEQIIKNLLSNAFKFTPEEGSITLKVDLATDPQVFYSEKLKNSNAEILCFSVSDTGIGIPEEKQRLIFEAFQQADGSTSRKYGGTGLGLSISKELASLLGGEIQLSSVPGLGSTFKLYLPIVEPELTGSTHEVEAASHPAPPPITAPETEEVHTLLIVEDDLVFAKLLENYAVQKGYKPVLAHDGKKALEIAQDLIPHAIILDIITRYRWLGNFESFEGGFKNPEHPCPHDVLGRKQSDAGATGRRHRFSEETH